nr:RHS repeat-associated core domain-containing protein [Mesonia aestuariivivens]
MARWKGFYYYGARYYAAWIGRFISVDPLVEKTMEAYIYVSNNPLRYTYPTGMSKDDWMRKKTGDTWVWREDITFKKEAAAEGLQYGGKNRQEVSCIYLTC